MFESTPTLTANALAERELAHRALAAEIAQGDLEAAAGEAQVAATRAEDEVRACAEALMLAEGTAIAEQVAALDAQALALRVRLGGGAFAPIAVRGQPLSPVLAKILRETDELGLAPGFASLFAGPLYTPMRKAGKAWLRFVENLSRIPVRPSTSISRRPRRRRRRESSLSFAGRSPPCGWREVCAFVLTGRVWALHGAAGGLRGGVRRRGQRVWARRWKGGAGRGMSGGAGARLAPRRRSTRWR